MRYRIPMLLLGVAVAAGCHSRETAITRTSTTDYQTVSEGSAQGAAASIGAPGETPPLVSTGPLTSTNVDTTTTLTITNAQTLPPNTGVAPLGTSMSEGIYTTTSSPPAARPRSGSSPRQTISISRSPSTQTLSEDGGMTPTRDATTQTLSPSKTTPPPASQTPDRKADSDNPPPPGESQPEQTPTATST